MLTSWACEPLHIGSWKGCDIRGTAKECCGEQLEFPVVSTDSARGVFEVVGGPYIAKTSPGQKVSNL